MSNEITNYKLSDMQIMADAIARSGLFGMKSPDQALALMLVAQAENQHPATITQDYDIIQGKACRKTHSVMSRFQQMGGTVEWHQLNFSIADATFSHPAGGALRIEWTIEQARNIGLAGKDNWKNYPRAMLRARLIAEGVRAVYPAAIGGMMIAEEATDATEINMGAVERIDERKPKELPAYTEAQMVDNMPQWRERISSGKSNATALIFMIKSKYVLTDEQIERILALQEREPGEEG